MVGKNRTEHLFALSTYVGLSYALPLSETAENYLRELNIKVSDELVPQIQQTQQPPPTTDG